MGSWNIYFDHFDPAIEGVRESLCTLGNGYFAIRGAAEESVADEMHYPGLYLAGGYNRLKTVIKDEIIENEDLVNFPNCLPLTFKIGNLNWFNLKDVKIISYEQILNMQEGVLSRTIHFQDQEGKETRFSVRRLVSMDDPHVVAIEMIIQAENWSGEIEILSALDGRVENAGVERYMLLNRKHLEPIETDVVNDAMYLKVCTNQSLISMAQAARTRVLVNGQEPQMVRRVYKEDRHIAKSFKLRLQEGQPLLIEKLICIYTSKDRAVSECGLEARQAVERLGSFEKLFEKHRMAWKHIWRRFGIEIVYEKREKDISLLLRLHIFHILQTISMHSKDLDVGVPPRGWHGEAYRGHILWDELFIFSTLNHQFPELTRSLLLYRYRRLNAARCASQAAGFKGAMYPWQSGSDGREESQRIHLNPRSGRWIPDHSRLARHVNAAIAFNIWQHYQTTADLEFLSFYGAEMILEIARFWASHSIYNFKIDRYEIHGVIGPDEYHDRYPDQENPGINNNAYTNVMVSWTLARALQVLEIIPKDRKRELQEMLSLSDEELLTWDEMRKKLYIPFHDGVISQFEGYETLKELDWGAYRKKYHNIQRLDRILEAEGGDVNLYKVSKQADVLMLFYLFSAEELRALFEEMGYELSKKIIRKTVEYYIDRTSNGSTLSNMIHAWVLSRSDRETSWNLFCEVIQSDFSDVQGGTTAEGIHLGAMAGTVDLIQRCYSGFEFRENVLRFHPRLPKELKEMKMTMHYRNHSLVVHITHHQLRVTSQRASATPIHIAHLEQTQPLHEGQTIAFKLKR